MFRPSHFSFFCTITSAIVGVFGFTGIPDAWMDWQGFLGKLMMYLDGNFIRIIFLFLAILLLAVAHIDWIRKFITPGSILIPLPVAGYALYKALTNSNNTSFFFSSVDKQNGYNIIGARLIISKTDGKLWARIGKSKKYSGLDRHEFTKGRLQEDARSLIYDHTTYWDLRITQRDLSRVIKNYIASEIIIRDWDKKSFDNNTESRMGR